MSTDAALVSRVRMLLELMAACRVRYAATIAEARAAFAEGAGLLVLDSRFGELIPGFKRVYPGMPVVMLGGSVREARSAGANVRIDLAEDTFAAELVARVKTLLVRKPGKKPVPKVAPGLLVWLDELRDEVRA